jgi:uncharacterized protein DUF3883
VPQRLDARLDLQQAFLDQKNCRRRIARSRTGENALLCKLYRLLEGGVKIDDTRFQWAHGRFEEYILAGSGQRFTSFDNWFFRADEIDYKVTARTLGRKALELKKWKQWLRQPGQILAALRTAAAPAISRNLIEHRWGGPSPFSGARTPAIKRGLEACLYELFTAGLDRGVCERAQLELFGRRFDALAAYLRENRLGCDWSFVSYIAFLAAPYLCFPIRPSRFERLLRFYGIDEPISKRVTWERYSILLELADALRERLEAYGSADNIALQSYMWVASRFAGERPATRPQEHDPAAELQRRLAAARERERIGWLGEQAVVASERDRLSQAGCHDLARRVAWVARDGDEHGFDVLSFEADGREIHIEVKSTAAALDQDPRFWLSDVEKRRAEEDMHWTVYRVSDVNQAADIRILGNIVTSTGGWKLSASTWLVTQTVADESRLGVR